MKRWRYLVGQWMSMDRENLGNQGFLDIFHSTKNQPFFKGILSITLRDFPKNLLYVLKLQHHNSFIQLSRTLPDGAEFLQVCR